jgi:hypothetical protein
MFASLLIPHLFTFSQFASLLVHIPAVYGNLATCIASLHLVHNRYRPPCAPPPLRYLDILVRETDRKQTFFGGAARSQPSWCIFVVTATYIIRLCVPRVLFSTVAAWERKYWTYVRLCGMHIRQEVPDFKQGCNTEGQVRCEALRPSSANAAVNFSPVLCGYPQALT